MHRCLELARKAAGRVAPNPMVGAVLVYNNMIIGEGYHQVYGGPHAEVNCIDSVPADMQHHLSGSVMYVSLEPCAHHGKTPPCADLIVRKNIPRVIIGCRDPFTEVDGKGIEKLQAAGIATEVGILEAACKHVNRRFFTFHTLHRPYIILKWAQTGNNRIGNKGNNRLRITGGLGNHLVHKWRSEEASILVGTNTAAMDDPQLTNRLWNGSSPTRIVVDLDLKLSPSLHIFDGSTQTIVFNIKKNERQGNILYHKIDAEAGLVQEIVRALYRLKVISVLIEGGARLLQSFIDEECWDEARVMTNPSLLLQEGVDSPVLSNEKLLQEKLVGNDQLRVYIRG